MIFAIARKTATHSIVNTLEHICLFNSLHDDFQTYMMSMVKDSAIYL